MDPVQVFGQMELQEHLLNGGAVHSHLISIGNPRRMFGRPNPGQTMPCIFRKKFRRYLRLSFFDAESLDHLGSMMKPKRVASRRDIRKVIRFYEKTKDDASGYTIHCWSGVSRSAAIAIGVLYLMLGSEDEAKDVLLKIRPVARPLTRIVKLFDSELKSNLAAMHKLILSRYIEDLKSELDLDAFLEELPAVIEEDHCGHEK